MKDKEKVRNLLVETIENEKKGISPLYTNQE